MTRELSKKQLLFIEKSFQYRTREEAAKAAKVPYSTARSWYSNPEFMSAWRDARKLVLNHALVSVCGDLDTHARVLLEESENQEAKPSERIAAAKTAFDIAMRSDTADAHAELEEIKAQVAELQNVFRANQGN